MTKLFTIVCCVGNEEIFKLRLGISLKGQETKYELIKLPVDKPMPEIFNSLDLDEIKTKYIMFVHEDVLFMDKNWIERTYQLCEEVENLGVAGVAGVTEKGGGYECIGHILHWGSRGIPRQRGFGNPIYDGKIIPVQTLDAQCLIVPTEIFKKYKFNEDYPFHMMAEDYCLQLKYLYNKDVVVIPLKVWHNEAGLGRVKTHGEVDKWHKKLYEDWNERINRKIYVTSKAIGLGPNLPKHYCPICGGDVDTLTTHVRNPEYKFECRVCHHKWGKRR